MSPSRRPAVPTPVLLVFMLLSAAATGGHGTGGAATAAVWSNFGLVVQKHAAGQSAHTTETSGIIIRAPDPQPVTDRPSPPPPPPSTTAVVPTALGKSWTQISVTNPPPAKSSQLVTASTPIRMTGQEAGVGPPVRSAYTASTTTARSTAHPAATHDALREIPHRYQQLVGTSKPMITITFPPPRQPTLRPPYSTEQVTSKRVRQYEDDDDDDDDDDDEYDVGDDDDDDDDDDVHEDKGEEEEIEEIVEVQHIDSDNYGDEKPSIVKKKRRRKKKGKKHKPFKVKDFKKLKKFMLPLLLAYKLKFFTLVPLMLGGLVLIVATTGFAGFFFALFAVGLGLKGHH